MSTLSKSIGFHTAPFELKFNKELDYEKLKEQTQILDIIAQMGNLHICILDFYKHSFFYVSDPFFLCENDMKESLNIGEAIVERIIYHDDKEGQREMKDAACVFFGKYDRETQKNIILYSSHRLMYQEGKEFMITNKFKPFMFDDNNNVWMAIGTTSFATKNQKIESYIEITNKNERYVYSRKKKDFILDSNTNLSNKEREVLNLAAQGCTTKDIAVHNNTSINTIKFHKQHILSKLKVQNISEAIQYAYAHNLI